MPSFAGTRLRLAITGAEGHFTPARFSGTPLRLSLTSGSAIVGPNLASGLVEGIAAILDTLFAGEAIVDTQGRPTRRFQQIWQNTIGAFKDLLTSQGLSITELQRIYSGINTAQSTAASAVQTANATQASISLANSYVSPVGVLTASSDGTVTIAAHTRVYGDGTSVNVNGGTVTATGSFATVFYIDGAREGGAVVYQVTSSAVAQEGSVHVVGQVAIPLAGEPDVAGSGPTAPGYLPPSDPNYDPRDVLYEYPAW